MRNLSPLYFLFLTPINGISALTQLFPAGKRQKIIANLLTVMLVFASACPVFGREQKPAQGPVDIEADSLHYDREDDTYQARGRVVITFAEGRLQADSIVLNRRTNKVMAEGRVILRTEDDVLEGERVDFDLTTQTGAVYGGKMFIAKNHFYVRGERIEKQGPSNYRIQEVSVTTCDGDAPDWRLTGRELNVTVDGYGTLKGGKFFARDVPLLYIPYFIFPAKTTRQTGLLFPHLGYSRQRLGWDTELPFFLAISQQTDATFYQRYMDRRGFKEGVEFRYFLNKDSSGILYGDYLRDRATLVETSGSLTRDWHDPQERWSLYVQNSTSLQPDLHLRADLARVSDKWYFRDFSTHNYYLDHYSQKGEDRFKKIPFVADESLDALESTFRVVKDWSLYNLTALVRYTDDLTRTSNEATLQRYPEITLAGVKQSFFGTPVNLDLSASLSENYRREGQKGQLFDLKPVFSLPIDLGRNFRLIPAAEARGTIWKRNDETAADSQGHRTSYRVGADLVTSAFRDYTPASQNIEKIRHEIKPELVYDYIPFFDQVDLPDFAEAVPERNTLTAALTNTLTAKTRGKDGVTNYLELLRLKLSQISNIAEARRDGVAGTARRPFGAIDIELDLKPLPYFAFYARSRMDVKSGAWEKANYDLQVSDKRGDSAAIGYRYTRDLLEEIDLSLNALLTQSVRFSYILKRNEFDNSYFRNAVALNYQRQCWSIGLSYSDNANDRSLMVNFSLTGLAGTGYK